MIRSHLFVFIVGLIGGTQLMPANRANAQKLRAVSTEVRSEKASSTKKASPQRRSSGKRKTYFSQTSSNCDDSDDDLTSSILIGLFKAPFVVPRLFLRDESYDLGYFPRYPYLHQSDGFITDSLYTEEGTDAWLLRLRTEYFDDFDSTSYWGGSVLLDTAGRFGLDSEVNRRHENLPSGSDSLWNGDANVVFRFAQNVKMQMRAGAGLNWLDDDVGSEFGFNFTYGGDWFPTDPWIVSSELDLGTLRNASLVHLRTTVGAHYHRLELFSGYDYFSVGNATISGPVFGLRLWY